MPGGGGIYIELAGSGSLSVRSIPPLFVFTYLPNVGEEKIALFGARHINTSPSSGKQPPCCRAEVVTRPGYTATGACSPIQPAAEEDGRRSQGIGYLCVKELFRA